MCSCTRGPMWRIRVSGVIGNPSATSAPSTRSASAPASIRRRLSLNQRVINLFTTKPGESFTSTAVLPSDPASANAAATTASVLRGARTISTSGSTATGLKKWKPIRRSGCRRPEPWSAIESEEVFVSSSASARTTRSIDSQTPRLTARSSKTASITMSLPARSAMSLVPVMSAATRSRVSVVMVPRVTARPSWSAMQSSAWATCSGVRSVSRTGTSRRSAKTRASWVAIRPPPTTPTWLTPAAGPPGRLRFRAACRVKKA